MVPERESGGSGPAPTTADRPFRLEVPTGKATPFTMQASGRWAGRTRVEGPGSPAIGADRTGRAGYAAPVCLLLFSWQVERSFPLLVAANRDERLERPARAFSVLRDHHPRVLGGHDDLAGGTWLAVNEHGVVAGLTNRPSPEGRDPTRRTRGELPLMATGERTAAAGVETLVRRVRPEEYNPAWLLVGDRTSLYYVALNRDAPIAVVRLGPGVHVLENVALDQPSPKSTHIGGLAAGTDAGGSLWDRMPSILGDHTIPDRGSEDGQPAEESPTRLPATLAACVHTDGYGTRSATLVRVPSSAGSRPRVLVADGPPCTSPFADVTARWER